MSWIICQIEQTEVLDGIYYQYKQSLSSSFTVLICPLLVIDLFWALSFAAILCFMFSSIACYVADVIFHQFCGLPTLLLFFLGRHCSARFGHFSGDVRPLFLFQRNFSLAIISQHFQLLFTILKTSKL